MKSIEETLNINYTSNNVIETRLNIKFNKNASKDDSDAYDMLEYLKTKNINLSKHIRLLLALEFRGELLLPDKLQVVDTTREYNTIQNDFPVAATVVEDVEEVIKADIPPSDEDL